MSATSYLDSKNLRRSFREEQRLDAPSITRIQDKLALKRAKEEARRESIGLEEVTKAMRNTTSFAAE